MGRRLILKLIAGLFAVTVAGLGAHAAPPASPAPEVPVAEAPPAGGPSPHIVFDSAVVNLGDVVRGKDAVATFSYRNTGDAPLHILSAHPG